MWNNIRIGKLRLSSATIQLTVGYVWSSATWFIAIVIAIVFAIAIDIAIAIVVVIAIAIVIVIVIVIILIKMLVLHNYSKC